MASSHTPLFDWLDKRAAGLLLHPTSLPSDTGVGNFGAHAYKLVDFLAEAGFKYWQMCPLGPTGFGDSPYQCFSAFAGNPYLIDLEALLPHGLLEKADLTALAELPRDHVEYSSLYVRYWPVLRLAFRRFHGRKLKTLPNYGYFEQFKEEQAKWLDPFALFMGLKAHHGGRAWPEWPEKARDFSQATQAEWPEDVLLRAEEEKFYQYLFYGQWNQLRRYAAEKGVGVIGDVPIFVAFDGADVWSRPELFQLDKSLQPEAVAGVPPDYFSKYGQLWGNPLFDWSAHKREGYQWWIDRLEANFALYDIVRLDHFRGFQDYWRVPATAKDARGGKWVEGPGLAFFKAIKKAMPEAKIIAEDLGDLSNGVHELLADTGLPGMRVLHFAFDGNADNSYLPHNHNQNSVVYPGTHDNDTTLGWYKSQSDELRHLVRVYLSVSGDDIAWDLIRVAYQSTCRLAVVPMQDLLSLDSDARLNSPGQSMGNWQWRYAPDDLEGLTGGAAAHLRQLGELYGRCAKPEA